MSTVITQKTPVGGSIESVLDTPLPYVVQALLRAVDEALNMPEPQFEKQDEDAYLTAVARRLDTVRELLGDTIKDPSVKNTAKTVDEMGRWLTTQELTYRPLEYDDSPVDLEPSPA